MRLRDRAARRIGLLHRAAFSYVLASIMLVDPVSAADIDPHRLYETHCSRCHAPHAGDFVLDNLEHRDGRLIGVRSGKELQALLATGHGGLTPPEVDVMVAHLAFILESGAVFREHCFICHRRAVTLARSKLTVKDGRLVGRYTGRDIGTFLENHGRLKADEIPAIVLMLERQITTVE